MEIISSTLFVCFLLAGGLFHMFFNAEENNNHQRYSKCLQVCCEKGGGGAPPCAGPHLGSARVPPPLEEPPNQTGCKRPAKAL